MTQRHLFGNPAVMHFWVFLVLVRGHFIRYKKCLVIFIKFYKKFAIRKKYLSVKYALDMKFHARYNSMNMRKHEQIFQLCSNPSWKIEYKTNSYCKWLNDFDALNVTNYSMYDTQFIKNLAFCASEDAKKSVT